MNTLIHPDKITLPRGDLEVVVNFGERSLDFATTNTQVKQIIDDPFVRNPGLDLSGTLKYKEGSNSFTGDINAKNSGLSGTADGRFYGPEAEELGGVFSTRSSGVEAYDGAFGAKKQ